MSTVTVPPILQPLVTRAFITAIVGAIVAMLVIAVPQLQQFQDTLVNMIVVLTLALIGGDTVVTVSANSSAAKIEVARAEAATATEYNRMKLQIAQIEAESVRAQIAAQKAV